MDVEDEEFEDHDFLLLVMKMEHCFKFGLKQMPDEQIEQIESIEDDVEDINLIMYAIILNSPGFYVTNELLNSNQMIFSCNYHTHK